MTHTAESASFFYDIVNAVPREVWLLLAVAVGILAGYCLHRTRTGIVVGLVLTLLLPAPAMAATTLGRAGSVVTQAPTVVQYFETTCEREAREDHGVPPLTLNPSRGLVAWQRQHLGTPEGEAYNQAATACPAVPDFDFSQRELVWVETVG